MTRPAAHECEGDINARPEQVGHYPQLFHRLQIEGPQGSPYDDQIDKAAYFERCWPNRESIRAHVLERICESGGEAFVLYKCVTNDEKEFRNTEYFDFEGDRIRQINVYFGAAYKHGAFVKSP